MQPNIKDPDEMTVEERLQEVSVILAKAVTRSLEKESCLTGLPPSLKRSYKKSKSSQNERTRKVK